MTNPNKIGSLMTPDKPVFVGFREDSKTKALIPRPSKLQTLFSFLFICLASNPFAFEPFLLLLESVLISFPAKISRVISLDISMHVSTFLTNSPILIRKKCELSSLLSDLTSESSAQNGHDLSMYPWLFQEVYSAIWGVSGCIWWMKEVWGSPLLSEHDFVSYRMGGRYIEYMGVLKAINTNTYILFGHKQHLKQQYQYTNRTKYVGYPIYNA